MARHFADRLAGEEEKITRQVELGFELVAGRPPSSEEQSLLSEYASRHGMDNLCRSLFSLVNLHLLIDHESVTDLTAFLCFPIHNGWAGLGIDAVARAIEKLERACLPVCIIHPGRNG